MEELLTVQDCAVILSLSERKVREYMRLGILKAHKIGANVESDKPGSHPWRVWESDLTAFINGDNGQ